MAKPSNSSDRDRASTGAPLRATLGFWALLCLGAFAFAFSVVSEVGSNRATVADLLRRLRDWGRLPGSPLILLACHTAASLACFPGLCLVFLVVSCAGTAAGAAICLLGTCCSAFTVHVVSGRLGRPYVEARFPAVLARAQRFLTHRSTLRVIQMRLLPFIPFHVVNAACGLARVPLTCFIAGTGAGVLPKMAVNLYFVSTLLAGFESAGRIFWVNLAVSLTLFVVVTVCGILVERRLGGAAGC